MVSHHHPALRLKGHSPMTKVTPTAKTDQVQLTDEDLKIVTGGTKSKQVKQVKQIEFLKVRLIEVFLT
jgi:hypothetical protein